MEAERCSDYREWCDDTGVESDVCECLLIYDIRTVRTERQSVQLSKIEDGGLDQYVAEPFEQQQFGTAGVAGLQYK